ncbi:regulator of G protein signaling domain-containing protein [Mucor mucedo]|uniref:regulator of G protein signaling domain-containing protein n=1 Tax=Mucor mucedo TaxID=29922 RepID=UPI00221F3B6F|nr:regulator of G protein signaling domain-containing protein [Mucor mucedo]KAI7893019.1 regulator of G protein signaling domain-containing protein [Mucor mucedo]
MYYNPVTSLSYKSILDFTIDGRPSVDDIHGLFFTLMSQITFSTNRYMFRNYANTFTSEQAISEIGALNITSAAAARASLATAQKMERDMSKALIQQFLWTRLIENAVEPGNRTYRDKGLYRLKSKGLCVLQDFCIKSNIIELLVQFKNCVEIASTEPMFLIHVERTEENDRMNTKRKYITSLFAIMIASLPLRKDSNSSNTASTPPPPAKKPNHPSLIQRPSAYSHLDYKSQYSSSRRIPAQYDMYSASSENGFNSLFQQQKALLQNLSPSSANKFKMRSVFPSLLCCDWLVGFCTVASNDEAESIMTEFLNLGWITFYDEKHRNNQQVEASKSIALRVTGSGMKVVIDVSLEHSIISNFEDMSFTSRSPPSIYQATYATTVHSEKNNDSFTPIYNASHQQQTYEEDVGYFDTKQTSKMQCVDSSVSAYVSNSPPLTPNSFNQTSENNRETNHIKLKAVLKDTQLHALFRNFLNNNFCSENLDFWKDHNYLRRHCHDDPAILITMSVEKQQQLLQEAYILWTTYLSPGSARELNIDHMLREDMAEEIAEMVTLVSTSNGNNVTPKVIFSGNSAYECLITILNWFDRANDQVCKLLAADSIPKFVRTVEYKRATMSQFRTQDTISKASLTSSDFDNFPPPPQRKLKETMYS